MELSGTGGGIEAPGLQVGYQLIFVGTADREQPVGVRGVVRAVDVHELAQPFAREIAGSNTGVEMAVARLFETAMEQRQLRHGRLLPDVQQQFIAFKIADRGDYDFVEVQF